jgi:hypothetical protein
LATIEDAEKSAALGPPTPDSKFNLACDFARAAGRVGNDREQPERETLQQRWQGRALDLLRQALDQLPAGEQRSFWRENAADPDLDPIRGTAGFRHLAEKYSGPGK